VNEGIQNLVDVFLLFKIPSVSVNMYSLVVSDGGMEVNSASKHDKYE
jgi:hypothetical protein